MAGWLWGVVWGVQEHPVVQLVHSRARRGSKPGQHMDGYKIGLAIEASQLLSRCFYGLSQLVG